MRRRAFHVPLAVGMVTMALLAAACGRSSSTTAAPASSTSVNLTTLASATADGSPSVPEPGTDLWARAAEGEADDLARLADREGATGLSERAKTDPTVRLTALKAAGFSDGLAAVSWLSGWADKGSDQEATAALDSLAELAARPRRALDPEDAPELREGCDVLVALAQDTGRPRGRRVGALRFVRMMADRGCGRGVALPSDVDTR